MKVIGAVWLPGLGAALSSIGFGAIITFSSLLAAERRWSPVWLIFSAFAVSLVTRFAFGHVPDRLGGARVALVCVLIEAAGLALIRLASDRVLAAAGAVLLGLGYSLVYPGLGVEAVRRATTEPRACDGRLHRLPRHCAWIRQSRDGCSVSGSVAAPRTSRRATAASSQSAR